ncbi:cytochrome c oxidase subunit II [Thalassolituus alkanivorans]|uniref:cytochrome c oxidase subunit II n=1 Tax=Thalassolituus alkanivorans TaxID=2881055 RepID=UPI0038B47538
MLAKNLYGDSNLNLPVGVTHMSREVYSLHMIIFWICVVIAVVVFGVMFWSLIRYRKSKGAKAAHFHENTLVEILWTAIPLVILVVMAIPATATLQKIYDTSEAEMDVMITGYQWRWHYEYLGQDVSFFSNLATPPEQIDGREQKGENYLLEVDQPLVLPVDTKVRLLLTSNDVIHSWWVPQLAVKKDAIPGFVNENWTRIDEPGIYRGQCTELCGRLHGFMPVTVKAVSKEDYQIWLAEQKQQAVEKAAGNEREWTLPDLMAQGETVYNTYCAACHMVNGQGIPPAFPALAGSPLTTKAEGRATHIELVLYGKAGTAMAAFGSTLSAADLAAVITYERNAFGNNTGDVVQPAEIKQQLKPTE